MKPLLLRQRMGVFFISAASLMLEVSLSRLLAVSLWHHFVFLIISCALLGYGAAGTWLFVTGRPRRAELPALLFAVLVVPLFVSANRLPFDPALVALNPLHSLVLCLYFVILAIPFFLAGLTISRMLQLWPQRSFQLYAFDLLGAAVGCGLFFLVAPLVRESSWLVVISALGCCSSLLLSKNTRFRLATLLVPGAVAAVFAASGTLSLEINDYKDIKLALRYPGASHIRSEHDAVSRVDWLRSPLARFAPGLSLNYRQSPPQQTGITIDGGRLTAFTPWNANDRDFYANLPLSLLFRLEPGAGNTLLLQVVGGQAINVALASGIEQVTAQSSNRLLGEWLQQQYDPDRVSLETEMARTYLASEPERFDRIAVSLEGALPSGGTGIPVLQETTLETTEAVQALIEHLEPGGWLAWHRYLYPPARAELRLLGTMIFALQSSGRNPESHLAVFRSISSIMFLLSEAEITSAARQTLTDSCRDMGYTLLYSPGMNRTDTSDSGRVGLADAVREMIKQPHPTIENSVFDLEPVTDDRPFFYHFLRYDRLDDFYRIFGGKWEALIEGGLLLPLVFLVVLILALIMIVGPFVVWQGGRFVISTGMSGFLWLGFGFMIVEIGFFEQLTRFLGKPTISLTLVLGGLLISSGIGSQLGRLLTVTQRERALLLLACALIVYGFCFSRILDPLAGAPFLLRLAVSFVLILLPGLLMGMPFPRGLELLGALPDSRRRIAAAWCLNSFASVLGSVGAMIIAVHSGLASLYFTAAVCYGLSWLMFRRL